MSKISLEPNASGSGTFTLAAPSSNTNRTLTLPDEEGTVATIENIPPGYEDQDALDLFNVSGSAPVFACRAWVNFDGTLTTGNIRASGNVSSVTRNAAGLYTVNFATAMPDAGYATTLGGARQGGTSAVTNLPRDGTYTASAVQVRITDTANGQGDAQKYCVSIFR